MSADTFKNLAGWVVALILVGGWIALKTRWERREDQQFQERMQQNAAWVEERYKPKDIIPPGMRGDMNAVSQASTAFLNAILANDFAAAYQMTTPSFRKKMTQEQFAEWVRANPVIHDPNDCIVWGNATLPKGGLVSACLRQSSTGVKESFVLNIQVEFHQNRWLVSDCTIKPSAKA